MLYALTRSLLPGVKPDAMIRPTHRYNDDAAWVLRTGERNDAPAVHNDTFRIRREGEKQWSYSGRMAHLLVSGSLNWAQDLSEAR